MSSIPISIPYRDSGLPRDWTGTGQVRGGTESSTQSRDSGGHKRDTAGTWERRGRDMSGTGRQRGPAGDRLRWRRSVTIAPTFPRARPVLSDLNTYTAAYFHNLVPILSRELIESRVYDVNTFHGTKFGLELRTSASTSARK